MQCSVDLFVCRVPKYKFNRHCFIIRRVITTHKAEVYHRSNNADTLLYILIRRVRLRNRLYGRGQVWN